MNPHTKPFLSCMAKVSNCSVSNGLQTISLLLFYNSIIGWTVEGLNSHFFFSFYFLQNSYYNLLDFLFLFL